MVGCGAHKQLKWIAFQANTVEFHTGVEFRARLDDSSDEVIRNRIDKFHRETKAALAFYDPSLICDVDASQTPIDVLRQIIDRLSELSHERPASPVEDSGELVHSGL